MKKFSVSLIILMITMLLAVGNALAIPTLWLTDGTNSVYAYDSDNDGVVIYNGALGAFSINVATGITYNALGASNSPEMDLNSVNLSSAAASTITIAFSEVDFTISDDLGGFFLELGGTTDGNITFNFYADNSNTLFGTSQLIGTYTTSDSNFSWEDTSLFSDDDEFSLSIFAEITHDSANEVSSFDARLQPVPEPATMLLIGCGLIGLAGLGRKRFFNK